VPGFLAQKEWHGRAMLVRKAEMLPLECIVRGRLAGSAHGEYVARGTVNEIIVPPGLQLTDAFAEPMFTPSTKARRVTTSTSASSERLFWWAPIGSTRPDALRDLFTRAAAALAPRADPRRHEVRTGFRGRRTGPLRRSHHARFVAYLAGRPGSFR